MDTNTFLSDTEKAAVIAFADNAVAFEAVKKVVLFSIYGNGTVKAGEKAEPMRNWAMHIANAAPDATNEQLGAELRANAAALNFIESAFLKLKDFKNAEPKKEKKNPAL